MQVWFFYVSPAVTSVTNNEYDPHQRLSNKVHTIGSKTFSKTLGYTLTRPTSLTDKFGDTTIGITTYEYDAMSRIIKEKDGNGKVLKAYTYDEYGQLVTETNNILDKTFQYEYNDNGIGNIDRIITNGVATQFTYGNTDHPDRLTAYNGGTISYDALGRPIKYGAYTYAWNKDKLSSIQRGSLSQPSVLYEKCSFTYNGYGQRIRKNYVYDNNVASTSDYSYVYDTAYTYDHSGRLIRELITETMTYTGGGTRTKEFVYLYDESAIIGCVFTVNGTANTYYYQRNLLGDVIGIYDTNGNKVVGYAYDAFGNCTITSASNSELALTNPIRYRGYYYDRETKLYYLNSRYYNPQWCRFISPDDTAYLDPESVNGLNLYCYCNNDPVNYADPSGHKAEWLGWILGGLLIATSIAITVASLGSAAIVAVATTGAITGGIAGALNAASTGGNIGQGIITGALVGITGAFNPWAGGLMASGMSLINDRINNEAFSVDSVGKALISGVTAFIFASGSQQLSDLMLASGKDTLLIWTANGISNFIFASHNFATDTIIYHTLN